MVLHAHVIAPDFAPDGVLVIAPGSDSWAPLRGRLRLLSIPDHRISTLLFALYLVGLPVESCCAQLPGLSRHPASDVEHRHLIISLRGGCLLS